MMIRFRLERGVAERHVIPAAYQVVSWLRLAQDQCMLGYLTSSRTGDCSAKYEPIPFAAMRRNCTACPAP